MRRVRVRLSAKYTKDTLAYEAENGDIYFASFIKIGDSIARQWSVASRDNPNETVRLSRRDSARVHICLK